jgi:hypothetical protein
VFSLRDLAISFTAPLESRKSADKIAVHLLPMPTADLVEQFMRRTGAAMRHVFKALPDGFMPHRRGPLYRES